MTRFGADVRIHPTAIVEDGVEIGAGSSVWDNVHIRRNTKIGRQCNIGGKTLIAYDVQIGDLVKINSAVYICYGVTLETGVMVGAGTIFTNDRFPRATNPELTQPRTAEPDEHTLLTRVSAGASIGAGSLIGCDLTVGRFAIVGMGSVVTGNVPDFHLVIGSPARSAGVVCRCGRLIHRFSEKSSNGPVEVSCPDCSREYSIDEQRIVREEQTRQAS